VAGAGFGSLFLPRVGQEVVISYLNGDPSRPLVTGSVYNGTNTTPVKLPDHQTQSTIATWSSKQGTAGNIVRFEDKKDAEQLYFHAQKDWLAEIENDLTTTVKKGAELHTIEKGDRLVSSNNPGVATTLVTSNYQPGVILGKALESYNSSEVGVITIVVGKN
jgi:type VI secretion system secreted protein VgrG